MRLVGSHNDLQNKKAVLVMEHVEGGDLKEKIHEKGLTREQIRHIFKGVC